MCTASIGLAMNIRNECLEECRIEGIFLGEIKATIQLLTELQFNKDYILKRLVERHDLTYDKALEYYDKYSNE